MPGSKLIYASKTGLWIYSTMSSFGGDAVSARRLQFLGHVLFCPIILINWRQEMQKVNVITKEKYKQV